MADDEIVKPTRRSARLTNQVGKGEKTAATEPPRPKSWKKRKSGEVTEREWELLNRYQSERPLLSGRLMTAKEFIIRETGKANYNFSALEEKEVLIQNVARPAKRSSEKPGEAKSSVATKATSKTSTDASTEATQQTSKPAKSEAKSSSVDKMVSKDNDKKTEEKDVAPKGSVVSQSGQSHNTFEAIVEQATIAKTKAATVNEAEKSTEKA